MKINFNSDKDLPLRKTLDLPDIIIAVKSAFSDRKKYCSLVFLDVCLCKIDG